VLFNTTGEIAILAIVAIRFELGVDRAQAFLLLQNRANGLLKG